jgi:hypothetical protein
MPGRTTGEVCAMAFKIGDRVKVTSKYGVDFIIGEKGTVLGQWKTDSLMVEMDSDNIGLFTFDDSTRPLSGCLFRENCLAAA